MSHLEGKSVDEILAVLQDSEWRGTLEQFLALDPGNQELRGFVAHAMKHHWDPDRISLEFKTTNFYKNTSSARSKWLSLSQSDKDALVDETAALVLTEYENEFGADWLKRNGMYDLNNWTIRDMATRIADGRLSRAEFLIGLHAEAIKYGDTVAGIREMDRREELARKKNRPEDIAEELWQLARRDYMQNITKDAALVWAKDILAGGRSMADFSDFMRDRAAEQFRGQADSIRNGMLPRQLMSTGMGLLANQLEMSEDQIISNDKLWGALQAQLGAEGDDVWSSMDWVKFARSTEEWRKTSNAHEEVASFTTRILEKFGEI